MRVLKRIIDWIEDYKLKRLAIRRFRNFDRSKSMTAEEVKRRLNL